MEELEIESFSRLDKYIVALVSLAWIANVIAIAMLWDKGNPRALNKSVITVAGASLVLIFYLAAVLKPGARDTVPMKILQGIGWAVLILGFAYFWISPFWRLPQWF